MPPERRQPAGRGQSRVGGYGRAGISGFDAGQAGRPPPGRGGAFAFPIVGPAASLGLRALCFFIPVGDIHAVVPRPADERLTHRAFDQCDSAVSRMSSLDDAGSSAASASI